MLGSVIIGVCVCVYVCIGLCWKINYSATASSSIRTPAELQYEKTLNDVENLFEVEVVPFPCVRHIPS